MIDSAPGPQTVSLGARRPASRLSARVPLSAIWLVADDEAARAA